MVSFEGYLPLPELYASMLLPWAGLLLLWLHGVYDNRKWRLTLISCLGIPMVFKLAFLVTRYYYWQQCLPIALETETEDRCSLGLYYVSQVFWLFSRGSLFAVIMLIAKGWTITRSSLPVFDARLLGSAVTTYIVALAFSRVVEQTVDIMRLVYLIFLLLMYICVIRLVFVNVDQNLRILKHQLFLVRQAFIDPASTPAWTKFIMYRVFHRCIFAFIFIEVTIQVLQNILVDVSFWIFRMSDELVFLYVTTGITVTFRTSRMNDYFEDTVAQLVEDGMMETPGTAAADGGAVGPAHWQPGLALPAAPRHVCDVPEVQVPTVVVVENPATAGDDGTLYPCVGVGTVLPFGKKEEEEDGGLRRGPGPLLPSEDVPASVAIVHTRSPAGNRRADDVDEQSRAVGALPIQQMRHVGSAHSFASPPDSSSETS